jgi:5-methylcytosine-specific restriction protein A
VTKPCIECGTPSTETRCDEHRAPHRTAQVGSSRARGYDAAWDRLSKRARKLSPFCEACSSTEELQLDHKPEAWKRKAAGKVIRLADVRVLCRLCNVDAGSSRPSANDPLAGPQTHGRGALTTEAGLRGKPRSPSLSSVDAVTDVIVRVLARDALPRVRRVVDDVIAVRDHQDAVGRDPELHGVGESLVVESDEVNLECHARSLS